MALMIVAHPTATFSGVSRVGDIQLTFIAGYTGPTELSSAQQTVLTGAGFAVGATPPQTPPDPFPVYLTDQEWADRIAQPGSIVGAAGRAAFGSRPTAPASRLLPAQPAPILAISVAQAATSLTDPTTYAGNDPRLRWTGVKPTPVLTNGFFYAGDDYNSSTFDTQASVVGTMHRGDRIEFLLAGNGAGRGFWLFADGLPVSPDVVVGPESTGGTHRLLVTFSTVSTRHLQLITNAGLVGVSVEAGDVIWKPTTPTPGKLATLGDSFAAGANAETYDAQSFGVYAAIALGMTPVVLGQAGTGYTQAQGSGGRSAYPDRVADLVAAAPSRIVILGSQNDVGQPTSAITAAAALTYQRIATQLPGVPVHVFGVQYPDTTSSPAADAADDAIRAAAQAAPNVTSFTSMRQWISTEARPALIAANDSHPIGAGHRFLGLQIAQTIAAS